MGVMLRRSVIGIKRRLLSSSSRKVLLTVEDAESGVATLTLNRPRQRNALSVELLEALKDSLSRFQADGCNDVRSVLIKANGPAFCSGHDLKEMTGSKSSEADHKYLFSLCSDVMQLVQEIPQPVVTAVHGIATAAGCQLVAASDIAVAAPSAKFATPGVSIGFFCSTPAVALVRSVGRKAAMDMLLTGRLVDAKEAHAMGLVSRVVEPASNTSPEEEHDLVVEHAAQLAKSIASRSGSALKIGKETFYRQSEANLTEAYCLASDAMVRNMKTNDATAGINAFLNKKEAPKWDNS